MGDKEHDIGVRAPLEVWLNERKVGITQLLGNHDGTFLTDLRVTSN